MVKITLLSTFLICFLAGCAVSSGSGVGSPEASKRALENEDFLEISGNYPRLIELYKKKLKEKDDPEVRLKLSRVYVEKGDNESALFTLSQLVTSPNANAESFYLQGAAQLNLGQVESALRSLSVANSKDSNNAKILNLLGVSQARSGLFNEARESLNKARSLLYDDATIKNNLAMIDMLEGDFETAVSRLMPIYQSNPNNVDKRVKANLAISFSKIGSFENLKRLYGQNYNETELFDIFQYLRASNSIVSLRNRDILSERIIKEKAESVNSEPFSASTRSKSIQGAAQESNNESPVTLIDRIPITQQTENEKNYSKPLPSNTSLLPSLNEVKETYISSESGSLYQASKSVEPKELRLDHSEIKTVLNQPVNYDYESYLKAQEELKEGGLQFESQTSFTAEKLLDVTTEPQVGAFDKGNNSETNRTIDEQRIDEIGSASIFETHTMNNNEYLKKDFKKAESNSESKHKFVKLGLYSLDSVYVSGIPVAQFKHGGQLIDVSERGQ
ncbi:tetratricopeptide repeat protein [Marinomonas fungiae]|uniref:tetratricopeptide repeat protein n=1 Tax=Marinomonas fungiae TaxID=1137284 RepID=UPI003A90024B